MSNLSWKRKMILGIVVWTQIQLIVGLYLKWLAFNEYMHIQFGLIALLMPSPLEREDNVN